MDGWLSRRLGGKVREIGWLCQRDGWLRRGMGSKVRGTHCLCQRDGWLDEWLSTVEGWKGKLEGSVGYVREMDD
jgi:hypothetical protein